MVKRSTSDKSQTLEEKASQLPQPEQIKAQPAEVIPPALTKEQQTERDKRLKFKTMKIRTAMGLLILFGVLTVMMFGHTYTIIGVAFVTCTMYFEGMRKDAYTMLM